MLKDSGINTASVVDEEEKKKSERIEGIRNKIKAVARL